MANNPDGKYETYHEVPGSKYFFISGPTGVAVHKEFFKWWSLFLVMFSSGATAVALLTDWWQQLIMLTLTLLYVQYWYVGFPTTFISAGIIYFLYMRRQKRIRKEKAKQAYNRRLAAATIKLAEEGVKNK